MVTSASLDIGVLTAGLKPNLSFIFAKRACAPSLHDLICTAIELAGQRQLCRPGYDGLDNSLGQRSAVNADVDGLGDGIEILEIDRRIGWLDDQSHILPGSDNREKS